MSQDKINQMWYTEDYALRYRPLTDTETVEAADGTVLVVRQSIQDEKTKEFKLIGQSDLRKIEVKYGWLRQEREMSTDERKRGQVNYCKAKLLLQNGAELESWLREALVNQPDLNQKIEKAWKNLITPEEIPVEDGLNPFRALIKFNSHYKHDAIAMELLMDKNKRRDPGTFPGKEGHNDKKYTEKISRECILELHGLYTSTNEELNYKRSDSEPCYSVLYEFADRHVGLHGDLIDYSKNMLQMLAEAERGS